MIKQEYIDQINNECKNPTPQMPKVAGKPGPTGPIFKDKLAITLLISIIEFLPHELFELVAVRTWMTPTTKPMLTTTWATDRYTMELGIEEDTKEFNLNIRTKIYKNKLDITVPDSLDRFKKAISALNDLYFA